MKEVKVFQTTRWFVVCPECGTEHDVDAYEFGDIKCCGEKFEYDNSYPSDAEEV